MTFLTPLFLLGLAALAIPVLIHLTQRERTTVVENPAWMFVKKNPYESVKRRRKLDAEYHAAKEAERLTRAAQEGYDPDEEGLDG